MPRVNHVNKARKDYPDAGIKKGESYYFWTFRFPTSKIRSKTYPKRSRLTQSPFLSQLYEIQDSTKEIDAGDIDGYLDELEPDLESLKEGCEESLENMPEALQDTSDTGILLSERIENLDEWIGEINEWRSRIEEIDDDANYQDRFPDIKEDDELADAINEAQDQDRSELISGIQEGGSIVS